MMAESSMGGVKVRGNIGVGGQIIIDKCFRIVEF